MDITLQSITRREIAPNMLFASTLFCSAGLMFVLQPMFGKVLLPLLGGAPSVWNTCMVFFQSILFLGYLYAHLLSSRLSLVRQLLLHGAVLFGSALSLPVALSAGVLPVRDADPTLWLLSALTVSIGLPFFILSTTAPLLQKWFSALGHTSSHDPYYLYVASNAGSLIALLSYPLVLEPNIGLLRQQSLWSLGFLLLCLLIVSCMALLHSQRKKNAAQRNRQQTLAAPPDLSTEFRWLALSLVPSSLLLALTHYISTDIAAVPLLWVIPLALYLMSFIIVFSKGGAAIHKKMMAWFPWIITPFLAYYFSNQKISIYWIEIAIHFLVFFFSIMVCHGELAKTRPSAQYLTQYYLIMSFGGMLGGMFNTFIAPAIFDNIYEYPIMIIAALIIISAKQSKFLYKKEYSLFLLAIVSYNPIINPPNNLSIYKIRNFYGVLDVKEGSSDKEREKGLLTHVLHNGTTIHGTQLKSAGLRCKPTDYYSVEGPIGQLFRAYDSDNENWNVGVIGLGAGSLSAYSKTSQQWTFYELNPSVVEIAKNSTYFSFLQDCIQNYRIQVGDARLLLDKEKFHQYDILIIDAFSSDSIPTHLMTKEAIELFFANLKTSGLLVFHISNRHLALKKVLSAHTEELGLAHLIEEFRPKQKIPFSYNSDWAVLSKDSAALQPLLRSRLGDWKQLPDNADIQPWTDDFTSIVSVLNL